MIMMNETSTAVVEINGAFATRASPINIPVQLLINFLEYADLLLRLIGLLIHLIYFYLVLRIKELRFRSLIYIHQINFFGLIFMLHYMCYITTNTPNLGNKLLNAVLCEVSEFVWASTKFLRSYSILLLAIFRMFAVVKIKWFTMWAKSNKIIALSIFVEYALSLTIVFISKFWFGTTYGKFYCQDGFSNTFGKGLNYFTLTSSIGILVPNLLVIIIYVITKRKLNQNKTRLNFINDNDLSVNNFSMKNVLNLRLKMKNQQESLIKQLMYINFFLVLSSLSFIIVNFANLFDEFSSTWYHYRLTTRIASLAFQSVVPIISLYGHPKLKTLFKSNNQPVYL